MAAPAATAAASSAPHTTSMLAGRRRAPFDGLRGRELDCPAARSADGLAASSPGVGDGCPLMSRRSCRRGAKQMSLLSRLFRYLKADWPYAEQAVTAIVESGFAPSLRPDVRCLDDRPP